MTPTWRITIQQSEVRLLTAPGVWPIVAEGDGPLPALDAVAIIVPPPPLPPPSPAPIEDTSPFVWPPQPTGRRYDPAERYAGLGNGFYAGQGFQNPLPGSTWYAGPIQAGQAGAWTFTGWDLWAPLDAAPATIRRALATGHL